MTTDRLLPVLTDKTGRSRSVGSGRRRSVETSRRRSVETERSQSVGTDGSPSVELDWQEHHYTIIWREALHAYAHS